MQMLTSCNLALWIRISLICNVADLYPYVVVDVEDSLEIQTRDTQDKE